MNPFLLTDQTVLDGGVSKQCEPEYLSGTIWIQVRLICIWMMIMVGNHDDDDDIGDPQKYLCWPLFVFPYYPLHSQGHGDGWHYIVFAGLSLHFQGHTDGCLLY